MFLSIENILNLWNAGDIPEHTLDFVFLNPSQIHGLSLNRYRPDFKLRKISQIAEIDRSQKYLQKIFPY